MADQTCTLIEGVSIARSDPSGDLLPGTKQGLFYRGARIVSSFVLTVNGARVEPLSATIGEPFTATFVGEAEVARDATDPASALLVVRHRYLGQGMREDIVLANSNAVAVYCEIELDLAADFADLSEVRDGHLVRAATEPSGEIDDGFRIEEGRGRARRGVQCEIHGAVPETEGTRFRFETIVPPKGEWQVCLQVSPMIGGEVLVPRYRCGEAIEEATPTARLEKWRRGIPLVATDHAELAATIARGADDLGSLRIFDPERPELAVVAAGVPWAMNLFGRDALLTGWMALIADPDIALGVLETLARLQGTKEDPRTEEQPGRILRELRFGPSSPLSLGGGTLSYCSVDTTPLFVMLLGELRRWGLAPEVVDRLLPHADRALEWIETYGDRDGDGYVEYERFTNRGLVHQGWKDSAGGVQHGSGRPASTPLALCEVQGYVYAAMLARAHFADEAGDDQLGASYRKRAVELRDRFNHDFWLESEGWLAAALDGDKSPVDSLTSNMGHCLWTGILTPERAEVVADRLLSSDLFSGWGVRTLAAPSTGYDPLGYHVGSVWPHDNALIAAGLMRYGFVEASHRIILGQLDAATAFDHRLPEMFAGLGRDRFPTPVGLPNASRPHACSAATPLLFLRTLLRLEPWMPQQKLWLAPALPEEITRLRVERIPLLGGRVTVDVSDGEVAIDGLPSAVTLVDEPRAPLTASPLP